MSQTAANASLNEQQRKRIQSALLAMPDTAFDWGNAIGLEESALETFSQRFACSSDPKALYRTMFASPADPLSLPSTSDTAAFRRFMARAADTLRFTPNAARERLKDL